MGRWNSASKVAFPSTVWGIFLDMEVRHDDVTAGIKESCEEQKRYTSTTTSIITYEYVYMYVLYIYIYGTPPGKPSSSLRVCCF